jgi:hypothetical protein
VILDVKGMPAKHKIQVRLIPASRTDSPISFAGLPLVNDYTAETYDGGLRLILKSVEQNQAYYITLSP